MSSNFVVYSVDKIPVQFCITFQETLREKFTWPRIISAFTGILFSVVLYFRNIHNIQELIHSNAVKLNLWIRHCERVLLLDSDQNRPIRVCLMQCTLTLTFGPISCLMQCQRNVLSTQMILG